MVGSTTLVKALPFLAASAIASVNYPTIPSDLTTPFQQRLAVYGANAVSVGWNTYEQLNKSCVAYGTSADSLTSSACSTTSSTYATSRTWSNYAVLTGLTPATTYYYKIVSGNSSVEHFLSPRTPGDKTAFSMDVVIDLGVYGKDGYTTSKRDTAPVVEPELNHTTIGALARTIDDYEIVIHPGDFAYADDWYLKFSNLLSGKEAYQAILEQFYDQLAPIAGRKLYMASPGNHEADCSEIPYLLELCPQGQKNFTDFMHRFENTMPKTFASSSSNTTAQSLATQARSLSNPPFWYSFEYGMAHIVMIDTETDFPDAPDGTDGSAKLDSGPFGTTNQQIDFLKADLASVDRSVTPWLIVAGHRPWYSTGTDNGCSACQTAFEDIFYKYGVDLGVFGHVHNSQRFAPVYNGTADANGMNDPKAPMYIVAGGAGNIEGVDSPGTEPSYTKFAYGSDYSYATIRFVDEQNLQVDFYQSSTGTLLDSSTLYKSHTSQFVQQ
ncbi:putative acid phosphatase [Penicillium brasilianum]|uniref:Purple acid phosphatase n=1 Tax=Penicillium brasilianum TaxID=104259 RepID=A0A1S9RDK4_PENBI|nr:putative acid phosphatase [Penicillium brasilianum]